MKNKSLIITTTLLIIAISSFSQQTGTFTDSRDGKVYKTVTIGTQTWMAENFAYKASSGCWAYNNDESKVATYGYLYDWKTAKTVCPSGWHLPSDAEWTILENYLIANGYNYDGSKINNSYAKSLASPINWTKSNSKGAVGNTDYADKRNSSGFSAQPGGSRFYNGTFSNFGNMGSWWSSTKHEVYGFINRSMYFDDDGIGSRGYSEDTGFSVRCIKD